MGELKTCITCRFCTTCCPIYECHGDKAILRNAPIGWIQTYMMFTEWRANFEEALLKSIFECVNCQACDKFCPAHIKIADCNNGIRRQIVEKGTFSPTLQDTLTSIYRYGNPLKAPETERIAWTDG